MNSNQIYTCIIPTYSNTKGLALLLQTLNNAAIPTVVIDNQPIPEKKILCKWSTIRYLAQAKNLGFAAGVNRGVQEAKTPWVIILNDDIQLFDSMVFSDLLQFARQKEYVAVSPILIKPDRRVENFGYFVLPKGKAKLNFDPQKSYSPSKLYHDISFINQNPKKYIDGLTAACLLIKKDVFETLGGFDESFFVYLEDVDLFLRLKKNGYGFGVCTRVSVIHHHQTTSKKMGKMKQYRDFVNWIKIITKHWTFRNILIHLPFLCLERLKNLKGIVT